MASSGKDISKNKSYSANALSGRERAKAEKSLVCLLRACQGYRTMIELRNENIIIANILNCDGFMNITVKDVLMIKPTKERHEFSEMVIIGKNIRYVHVPDEINIEDAITTELNRITKSRTTESQFGCRKYSNYRNKNT